MSWRRGVRYKLQDVRELLSASLKCDVTLTLISVPDLKMFRGGGGFPPDINWKFSESIIYANDFGMRNEFRYANQVAIQRAEWWADYGQSHLD